MRSKTKRWNLRQRKSKVFIGSILLLFISFIFASVLLNDTILYFVTTVFAISILLICLTQVIIERQNSILGVLSAVAIIIPIATFVTNIFFNEWVYLVVDSVLLEVGNTSNFINTLLEAVSSSHLVGLIIVISSLFLWFISMLFLADRTVMGIETSKLDKEEDYITGRNALLIHLEEHLKKTDYDAKYIRRSYTPLEADVETRSHGKPTRETKDLINALKDAKTEEGIYLVIGEAGSGKSVSLRKLSLDLLKESTSTGKIPIYINMKKWNPENTNIKDFIKETLLSFSDHDVQRMTKDYFDKMLEAGAFFFILDSFDEIPSVMASKNSDELEVLLKSLSESLYQFLKHENKGGGIVASRQSNSPTQEYKTRAILYIKPFNEQKVALFYSKSLGKSNAKKVKKEMFSSRQDLVYLSKNPLHASLISAFFEANDYLPSNQTEMFYSFLSHRFDDCIDVKKKLLDDPSLFSVKVEDIFDAASKMSFYLFENNKGLVASKDEMKENLNVDNFDEIVSLMMSSYILRGDVNNPQEITFVHRRFYEYFLVVGKKESNLFREGYMQYIKSGTGLYDALILYCEVAEIRDVNDIIQYCKKAISDCKNFKNIHDKKCMEAIRALMFLTEAFQKNKIQLHNITEWLCAYIEKFVDKDTDLICIEKFVESIVLYDKEHIHLILEKIFSLKISWISSSAIRRCYYLSECPLNLRISIYRYMGSLRFDRFRQNFGMMRFVFKVSKKIFKAKCYLYASVIDIILLLLTAAVGLLTLFSTNFALEVETEGWFQSLVFTFFNGILIFLIGYFIQRIILNSNRIPSILRSLFGLFLVTPWISGSLADIPNTLGIALIIFLFQFRLVFIIIDLTTSLLFYILKMLRNGFRYCIDALIRLPRLIVVFFVMLSEAIVDGIIRLYRWFTISRFIKMFLSISVGAGIFVFIYLYPHHIQSAFNFVGTQFDRIRIMLDSRTEDVFVQMPTEEDNNLYIADEINVDHYEGYDEHNHYEYDNDIIRVPNLNGDYSEQLYEEIYVTNYYDVEYNDSIENMVDLDVVPIETEEDNERVDLLIENNVQEAPLASMNESGFFAELVTLDNIVLILITSFVSFSFLFIIFKAMKFVKELIYYICFDRKTLKEISLHMGSFKCKDIEDVLSKFWSVKGLREFTSNLLDSKIKISKEDDWTSIRPRLKDEISDEYLIEFDKRNVLKLRH
ncbi:MAG: NACHT domain-containing protein [Defluviitaleaceae bacterium]|nr:NACHT domain-containing protein [Defluviitaleaceae bacterium]